jgi:hypothetical protein
MKKLLYILLLSPLFFVSSCEEETQSGYDCISNTCTAVFESPQYLTLSDCQNACSDNNGGNSNLEIGDIYQGGLIYYIDETGEHGLIAAMEDLTEGATDPSGNCLNGYEWGCYFESINGAGDTIIGTGYQNTMDIVNQGCETENGGITAAQAALDAEINGYSDWYLPSRDELVEMYNTIGDGGPEGNIASFESNCHYWSSSDYIDSQAWVVGFDNGSSYDGGKNITYRVRVIRSF